MSGPTVLIPGLACSSRLYAEQLPALWRLGPVMVANHARDDSMAAIARRILVEAPERFALAGLSMGGYICMEIMRQAPGRVLKLALLDTQAWPDTPEQSERRRAQIAMAERGGLIEVIDQLYPLFVHRRRWQDEPLRQLVELMAHEVGAEAFVRQQQAIMGRADSRPSLPAIGCPTLVLVGEGDELTPPDRAREMADAIPQAQLVIVPGSGHLSPLEEPEAVTAALRAWLQS